MQEGVSLRANVTGCRVAYLTVARRLKGGSDKSAAAIGLLLESGVKKIFTVEGISGAKEKLAKIQQELGALPPDQKFLRLKKGRVINLFG